MNWAFTGSKLLAHGMSTSFQLQHAVYLFLLSHRHLLSATNLAELCRSLFEWATLPTFLSGWLSQQRFLHPQDSNPGPCLSEIKFLTTWANILWFNMPCNIIIISRINLRYYVYLMSHRFYMIYTNKTHVVTQSSCILWYNNSGILYFYAS